MSTLAQSPTEIQVANNPFPGLRPFEFDESHLFFGRDGQSEQLIAKLSRTRFLAVVGTSGSGKSSLVRAGFLPALWGGFMTSAGSGWRVAIMRPGNDPIGNLARALNAPDVFGSDVEENAAIQTAMAESTLRRGSLGLVDTLRQAVMDQSENLLIVVDQFEEIFRFARVAESEEYGNEAAAFIKLLLEAARQREVPIYVVLTMRSDYLGDCSQFWGLPEAINESQYLIPRLTRDQLREAITGPVAVGGGKITPRLVNRLLNEVGDNQDQLPVLQHLLMRSWHEWNEKRLAIEVEGEKSRPHRQVHQGDAIDLCCADAVGGMAKALSRHADEAFFELPNEYHREVSAKLFKALTEKGTDNREIRRPITLAEICDITDARASEVITVIEAFRQPGRSFLMPPAGVALDSQSLVDISHESLIRGWMRLKDWVDEEARSARIYRRLAETAVLNKEGNAGLWRDPDLQIALNWREETKPNEVWARRYHPEFALATDFLDESVSARDAQVARDEAQRRKEINRSRLTALIFGVAFLFSLGMGVYAYGLKNKAEAARNEAVAERKAADGLRDAAISQNVLKDRALDAAKIAEMERVVAEAKKDDALKRLVAQKAAAEKAKNDALAQKKSADIAKTEALAQRDRAEALSLQGQALGSLKDGDTPGALKEFIKLREVYRGMKDPAGESYALVNMADIHKDQVPFALLNQDFNAYPDAIEDAEEGDSNAYSAAIRQYTQMMMVSMTLEGKDEKTLVDEISKNTTAAHEYYQRAFILNQGNKNTNQAFREAGILRSLGDLQIGGIGLPEILAEAEMKPLEKDVIEKEREKAKARAIQYYLEAGAAYGKARKPLEEAGVWIRIGDLLKQELKDATTALESGEAARAAMIQQAATGENATAKLKNTVGFYEEASEAFRRANRPLRQASALVRIGEIYKTLPKAFPDKERGAIPYYKRALEIYKAEDNFKKEGETADQLAQLHGDQSDDKEKIAFYKEAFSAYIKAVAVEKKQSGEPLQKAAAMLKNVAENLKEEDASQFFEEALSSRGNDYASKAQTLSLIGDYYKNNREVPVALKYYSRKADTWRQAGNLEEEGDTLVEIGSLQSESKNVPAAIEAFDNARKVYRKIGDRDRDASGKLIRLGLTANLMRMAQFYASQDKQKAIDTYEEALQIELVNPNGYQVSQILEGQAPLLLQLKTEEGNRRAEQLFQRVIEHNRNRKSSQGEANALAVIADVYKKDGDKAQARAYYERARIAFATGKQDAWTYQLIDVIKKLAQLEAEANPGKPAAGYYLSLAETAGMDAVTQGTALDLYADSLRGPKEDKQKLIGYYERVRQAFQAAGMKPQEINAMRTLALLYTDVNEPKKAQELNKKAEEMGRTP
jgi:hypothetical protein